MGNTRGARHCLVVRWGWGAPLGCTGQGDRMRLQEEGTMGLHRRHRKDKKGSGLSGHLAPQGGGRHSCGLTAPHHAHSDAAENTCIHSTGAQMDVKVTGWQEPQRDPWLQCLVPPQDPRVYPPASRASLGLG